jgi:glycosyltransferase involved in cell wall biosynthesis
MNGCNVSVIIPYCGEMPQILFTVRSIAEMLKPLAPFQIICVDNWCKEVEEGPPARVPDKGHDCRRDPTDKRASYGIYGDTPPGLSLTWADSHIKSMARKHDWLKYVRYDDKLSHWNAKNAGVAVSTGEVLWFVDAHVVPGHGVAAGVKHYLRYHENMRGTMHFPWTYHILESQRLIYKMVYNHKNAVYHYSTLNFDSKVRSPFTVPAMTTCGCLMSRAIYDDVGGWPEALGIYGGGENFLNFTLSTMAYSKWIYPGGTIHHHGAERGYNWNYDDYHTNRAIALYFHAGSEIAARYLDGLGNPKVRRMTHRRMVGDVSLKHLDMIQTKQTVNFLDWVNSQTEYIVKKD